MPNETYRAIQNVQQGPTVRRKLASVAERLAGHARLVAAEEAAVDDLRNEDVHVEIEVRHGTRPRGRSYSQVIMTPGDAEFGTSEMRRRRILGQAVSRL